MPGQSGFAGAAIQLSVLGSEDMQRQVHQETHFALKTVGEFWGL